MTGSKIDSGNKDARLASLYFASKPNGFWEWSHDLDTIVTRRGTTIAFYQEIVAVIRALTPEGLPSFDAIALFFAACRDSWPGEDGLMQEWLEWASDRPLEFDIHHLQQALDSFHLITNPYRSTAADKAALATIVFDRCPPAISSNDADGIVAHLESRRMKAPGKRPDLESRGANSLIHLMAGLNALDANTIAMQLRTGISTRIRPVDIPSLPPSRRARQLLQELRDRDDELAGLASIALDLMAAVHIPRAIDEPENLPLGGYSDISNRGAPDRLLLTELAQDDDVLAVRVNMNEALYLRREAPPQTPQCARTILIDTGIRLWGVPRVFATALGLALCATANERQDLRVFRSSAGDDATAENVDLFSRQGLIEHLGELTTSPHPGPALQHLVELQKCESKGDLIIITHPNAFADPEFQRTLASVALEKIYVALVDSTGTYELWLLSIRGRKRLQRAECRLDSILNPGMRPLASIIDPDIDPELPLALRMREFPLLAAQPLNSEQAAYHPDVGLAAYLRDGRVILWEKRYQGGRILNCSRTRPPVVWIWIDQKHQEIWLIHEATSDVPQILSRIPLNGEPTKEVILDLPRLNCSLAFAFHPGGHLLCSVAGREIVACSPETGQKIASLEYSKSQRLYGRYVQDISNQWHILSLQHTRLIQEPVPAENLPKSEILRCFDRSGHEGIHVILTNGSIFRLRPEPSLVHKMPMGVSEVRAISRDGHRILYVDEANGARLLDLTLGRFETIPPRAHHPIQLVEKNVALFHKRMPSLRKNFRSIAVTSDGSLALITRNNQVMIVSHMPSQGIVQLQPSTSRPVDLVELAFSPIESPFSEHHSLSCAECDDGTQIYLDSRGFLHIVPGDPTLPQVALVLKDGMLSGWFSDGAWFGDRYFLGDRTPIDGASAYDRLTHCFRNLQISAHTWT